MLTRILTKWIKFLDDKTKLIFLNISLLLARLSVGAFMAYGHGYGKLTGYAEISKGFPDPLGVGSSLSLALAIFAEFFCSIALMLGFATRFAALQLMITMGVAAFMIHGADPFKKKELALMYLCVYTLIFLLGAGKFSVDHLLVKKLTK